MDYTLEENQNSLRNSLREKTLLVTFQKLNGEFRDMECTLKPDVAVGTGGSKEPKEGKTRPTTSLAVYDVNKKAWRSFRWDSIVKVS